MVKSYDDAGFNKKQAHKVYKRDASRQQKAEEKSSQSDADKEVDLEPENSFEVKHFTEEADIKQVILNRISYQSQFSVTCIWCDL